MARTQAESVRLNKEKISQLQDDLSAEKQITQLTREKLETFINKCADLLGCPHDEESIVKFIANYGKVFDELNDVKDKYAKQTVALGEEKQAYEAKIKDLLKRIGEIEAEHTQEINTLRLDHKRDIARIKKEVTGMKDDILETRKQEKKSNDIFKLFHRTLGMFRR